MSEELLSGLTGYRKIFELGFDESANFFNRINGQPLTKSGGGVTVEEDPEFGLVAQFDVAFVYSATALGTSLKNKDWKAILVMRSLDTPISSYLTLLSFGTGTLYYQGCAVSLFGFVTSNPAGSQWDATYINPPLWPNDAAPTDWVTAFFSKEGTQVMSSVNTPDDPTPVSMPSMNTYYEDQPHAICIGGNLFPPSNLARCAIASCLVYVKD